MLYTLVLFLCMVYPFLILKSFILNTLSPCLAAYLSRAR